MSGSARLQLASGNRIETSEMMDRPAQGRAKVQSLARRQFSTSSRFCDGALMLKCSKCLKDKPEAEFYKDSSRTRGYYYVCRPCFAASRYGKRHVSGPKVKDPIKERARGKVRDAVRYGKISKPDSCQMCGKQTQQKLLDAHHFDGYDKPLNVRWLCRPCHGADHAGYGALPPSQSL